MEDLRSERPSGLDAYHVAGCPRNQFVKVWDLYVVIVRCICGTNWAPRPCFPSDTCYSLWRYRLEHNRCGRRREPATCYDTRRTPHLTGSETGELAANRKMRNVCSVEGCINGPRRLIKGSGSVDPSVSFHAVPRDEPRRSRWLNAVPMIRRQKELKKPVVCSLHFSPSDYVYNPVLGKALGVPQKGLLTRSAVPSLLAPSFPPQVPSQEQTSVSVSVES